MVVYDERNHRLEVIDFGSSRKRYIACDGIDPLTEKVLGADEFGDEVRVHVVPRVGPQVGTGVSRVVKYRLSQAAGDSAPTPPSVKPGVAGIDPFAARDPSKSRF